jgi:hypothetical protein
MITESQGIGSRPAVHWDVDAAGEQQGEADEARQQPVHLQMQHNKTSAYVFF